MDRGQLDPGGPLVPRFDRAVADGLRRRIEADGDPPLVLSAFGPVGRNAGEFALQMFAAFGLGLVELPFEPDHPVAHFSKLGELVEGLLPEDQVALFWFVRGVEKPAHDTVGAQIERLPVARRLHAKPRFGEPNYGVSALFADIPQECAVVGPAG